MRIEAPGGHSGAVAFACKRRDPVTMSVTRQSHTATLLPTGKALIVGGVMGASAELYDPSAGTFTATGNMTVARWRHTATLFPSGTVLIAGGDDGSNYLASAELYDPVAGTFSATGSMTMPRQHHTATLLGNSTVLIADGENDAGYTTGGEDPTEVIEALASAELYAPETGACTATSNMTVARFFHTATLLLNGNVLIAGGDQAPSVASAELYDPSSGSFSTTGSMIVARLGHTATLLSSGKVLIVGGMNGFTTLASAELYQ